MKIKKSHKKMSSGLAMKLVHETPRVFEGNLNDKKALAAYKRGETIYNSSAPSPIASDLSETLKELNGKVKFRSEQVKGMDEKFQKEMLVEDKIVRKVVNTIKKVKGFIRRKI